MKIVLNSWKINIRIIVKLNIIQRILLRKYVGLRKVKVISKLKYKIFQQNNQDKQNNNKKYKKYNQNLYKRIKIIQIITVNLQTKKQLAYWVMLLAKFWVINKKTKLIK